MLQLWFELWFEFRLGLGSVWRAGGADERSEFSVPRLLAIQLCVDRRQIRERSERWERTSFMCVRVCACVRAHIGASKIVSKILIMRCYWSLPIGNRTAVLLYCLFYLPKISVVYCH